MIDYFVNSTEFVEFKAGEIILKQGDYGDYMCAIKEGEVDISHNGKFVETMHRGQFFGEMSLVDHSPRSADAIAKTDCKIVKVNRHRFLFLVQETPTFALEIMHFMSERIRRMINEFYV